MAYTINTRSFNRPMSRSSQGSVVMLEQDIILKTAIGVGDFVVLSQVPYGTVFLSGLYIKLITASTNAGCTMSFGIDSSYGVDNTRFTATASSQPVFFGTTTVALTSVGQKQSFISQSTAQGLYLGTDTTFLTAAHQNLPVVITGLCLTAAASAKTRFLIRALVCLP